MRLQTLKQFSRLGIALAFLLAANGLARAQWTPPLNPLRRRLVSAPYLPMVRSCAK